MKSTFARRISILLVLAMVLAMLPMGVLAADSTTLYLKPNDNWLKDGARFAAYFFGNGETWVDMTDADGDGVYEVEAPAGYPSVIFCRMNPSATANNWNNKWNQTGDLTVPTDGTNLYTVPAGTWDKGAGTWSTYTVGDVVTTPTEAPRNYSYYVAGDFNDWNQCNDDYGMTLVDGVYTLTVDMVAGTYLFKVTDGTWTNAWGAEGGSSNYEFVLDSDATVTFTFDTATNIPAVTSSAMGEVVVYDYYLVGEMNGWTEKSSQYGLTANEDGTYSITVDLATGTYQYKINNGTWDVCFPAGTDNATVTVATDCAVTFTLDTVAGTITVSGDGIGETPVEPDPDPIEITSVNVKGTIPGMDWEAESTTGAMELVDGIYTITIDGIPASAVGADAYAFKVMINNTWDIAYPESDWTFYMSAEGSVTITYNPADNAITLTGEYVTYDAPTEGGEDPVDPEVNYYVAGSFNEWTANNADYVMTAGENGTYTYTFAALAAGTYSLKVTDGTWDNSWTAAEGSEYLGSDGNLTFTVTAACDVVVTFDGTSVSVAGDNITAKAPEALVVDKVVIAGGVTGDDTANPGNMFNGLIWTVDPEYTVNMLRDTEETPGVYSITFYNVSAGSYDFKFVINDDWAINFATGLEVTSGAEETAWFNALGNSTVVVAEDGSTVTFVLDLSATVNVGDNASMTVTVEAPVTSDVVTSAPESLVLGKNEFAIGNGETNAVVSTYTAAADGVLYISAVAMNAWNSWLNEMEEIPAAYIGMQFGRAYAIMVDGAPLYAEYIEVTAGTTYQIGVISYQGNAAEITLNLCTGHTFVDDTCSVCGYVCEVHNWDNGTCLVCGAVCNHETWDAGWCTNCYMQCEHSWTYTYQKGTAHNFTCSGACGAVIELDVNDVQFKIASAQPELASNIVMYLGGQLPAGMEYPRIEVEFNGETSYLYDSTINSLGRYEFAFDRINPKTMSDTFVATLYATVEGYEVSAKLEYSMLKYLNSQLKKSALSAANRTVMSDLIAYGDANQIYANYKTDALISTLLAETATLTPSTFTALDASYNVQKVISGDNRDLIDFKTVTLLLDSKVVVSVKVYCPNAEGYSVNVNLAGVDYTYPVSELEPIEGEDGYYYLNFEEIRASQFDEVVTVSFLNAEGTQISRTLEYSVYTYIQKNQNSTDTKLVDLLKAIYNYGEAAKAL